MEEAGLYEHGVDAKWRDLWRERLHPAFYAAGDDMGLAYTYEHLVRSHLRSQRLQRVLTDYSPTFPGLYLYYPSRKQQPAKLEAFVEYVLAEFTQD